ncbi:MAG: phospholipid carrier-dependent glycosyltransferase [Phycisphaerae bacterium]
MRPGPETITWLATAPAIGTVCFLTFRRLLRQRWIPDVERLTGALLSAVLVTSGWIAAFHLVAFLRLLGLLSGLSPALITAVFVAILALTWVVLKYSAGLPAAVTSLQAIPGEVLGASVVHRHTSRYWHPWSKRRSPTETGTRSRNRWSVAILLAPVALTHLILLAEGLSRMPAGHDGMKYRLPLVVTWLKADALVMRPDIWLFSLPANGELVLWWLLKGGFERVASVAFWPAAVLLGLAAWSIVRSLKGSRCAAALAVAILLSTHLVTFQVSHAYIDVFGTAFLASGVAAFFLAVAPQRTLAARRLLVVVAGLAIGIAIGAKPVNWVYAVPIAFIFFVVLVKRNRRNHDLTFLLPAFTLACLACSAFWFIRAGMLTGNPFYPVQVAVGDRVLLRGVKFSTHYEIYDQDGAPLAAMSQSPSRWLTAMAGIAGYAVTLNMLSGSVGPLFAMCGPLGMLVAAWLLLARGRRATRRNRATIAVLTLSSLVLWIGPLQHYARFGIFYFVLATCMAVPVIGWTVRYWPRLTGSALLASTVLACALVGGQPARELSRRLASGDFSRSTFYCLPPPIDLWPDGTHVINLSDWSGASALTYPLYGCDLKNDVIDYMTTRSLFPDLKPTVEQLQELGVDFIFVREPFRGDWPTDPRLELVYDDSVRRPPSDQLPRSRIYRVPPLAAEENSGLVVANRPN